MVKRFIKVNLIILVIICLACSHIAFAEENIADTNEPEVEAEEEKRERNLDDLELEKNELENQVEESNKQVLFIENQLSKTVVEISELTQEIYDKEIEIKALEAEEEELNVYIEDMEIKLQESNEKYNRQKELLEKRLVTMYEMGSTTYLDFLFSAKSLSDFLSNYYIISEIGKSDQELLQDIKAEKNNNKFIKQSLDAKKGKLSANKKSVEKMSIALSNMTVIKDKKMQDLTQEELEMQRKVQEYQDQIKEIETEIRLLTIANVGEEYIGGEMAWPVPGYTRITSPFGMRTHPVTGIYKLHTGTDIGAPYGSIFIAANDGVVVKAGMNAAYGNMVVIDHGGGVSTLYAHGSEILVDAGQTVTKGTPVLKVGSTGYSTGPHAHFEVRVNGDYLNPLDFITSYNNKEEKMDEEKVIINDVEENQEEIDETNEE